MQLQANVVLDAPIQEGDEDEDEEVGGLSRVRGFRVV